MNRGKGWATVAFLLGIAVSVAANVLHTYHPSKATLRAAGVTADQWHPELGAQIGAAFFPIALLLCVEVLSRVSWPATWGWAAARYGGAGVVALVAAIVSYRHMAGLLAAYGEDALTSAIGPAAVDGLMVVASFALLAIGRTTQEHPVPAVLVEREHPVPAALTSPESDPANPHHGTDLPPVEESTGPDHDPLLPEVRERFESVLSAGSVPSVRQIKAAMRVGHPRATRLRAALSPDQ